MKVERARLLEHLEEMKSSGYGYLVKITAVDYVTNLTVLYFLRDIKDNKEELVEVELAPSDAWVFSAEKVYSAANWYERELQEMFGIEVKGRHARRLLLEKWNGVCAPLRKNFAWGEDYEAR